MASDSANPKFPCPSCGKQWTWKPALAGKKAKCSCGTLIDVPTEPPAAAESPDDLFELAPIFETPQRPASTSAVIPYHGPDRAGEATNEGDRPGRVSLNDPFHGDLRKNLIVPTSLIVVAVALNLFVWLHAAPGAKAGISDALGRMATVMAIEIPVLIAASFIAVKFFEANLGPILPALLKLTSIALLPDAISDFLYLLGWLSGGGSTLAATVDGQIGSLIGWATTLILYLWFFVYYFELDLTDAYRMIIAIWVIRTLGGAMLAAYLYHP